MHCHLTEPLGMRIAEFPLNPMFAKMLLESGRRKKTVLLHSLVMSRGHCFLSNTTLQLITFAKLETNCMLHLGMLFSEKNWLNWWSSLINSMSNTFNTLISLTHLS